LVFKYIRFESLLSFQSDKQVYFSYDIITVANAFTYIGNNVTLNKVPTSIYNHMIGKKKLLLPRQQKSNQIKSRRYP